MLLKVGGTERTALRQHRTPQGVPSEHGVQLGKGHRQLQRLAHDGVGELMQRAHLASVLIVDFRGWRAHRAGRALRLVGTRRLHCGVILIFAVVAVILVVVVVLLLVVLLVIVAVRVVRAVVDATLVHTRHDA